MNELAQPSTIVGSSPAILAALDNAVRIARTEIPVLIVGETGTGKELFARHIHELSGRPGEPVCVDCGALPEELAESILLGHDRGAFTGAVRQSEGLIIAANGGTLFLDELSSLPLRGQAKLLRVLETGEVRRVGSAEVRSADFRMIATAQNDISAMVQVAAFRADLLQRVAGVIIRLPRLDDRPGDVPILARHFANGLGAEITPQAERALDEHRWRGNVRELRWSVARAAAFASRRPIGTRDVRRAFDLGPRSLLDSSASPPTYERRAARLRRACAANAGDANRVAEALGIGRSTLYRWLKDAQLNLRDFRSRGLEA